MGGSDHWGRRFPHVTDAETPTWKPRWYSKEKKAQGIEVYLWRHRLLTATALLLEYSLRSAQTAVWSLPGAQTSTQNLSDMTRWHRRHNG